MVTRLAKERERGETKRTDIYLVLFIIELVLQKFTHVASEDRGGFFKLALGDTQRTGMLPSLLASLSSLLLFIGSIYNEII